MRVAKRLTGDAKRIARADFQPKLTANQQKLKEKIVAAHREARFSPPEFRSRPQHPGSPQGTSDG